jgi:hypothetical protein
MLESDRLLESGKKIPGAIALRVRASALALLL